MIIEQHERRNAAQHTANAALTQPCFVRQTVLIVFRGRIVEPGGGVDIHLVADEYGKSRLDSRACSRRADDYSVVGAIRDRFINEPGGILARREREARAARQRILPDRRRIIWNDSVQ